MQFKKEYFINQPARYAIIMLLLITSVTAVFAEEIISEVWESAFEQHGTVMLLIDAESGSIVRSNQAAREFYGYSRDELESLTIDSINMMTPDEITSEMQSAAQQQRNYFIFPHRLSDGSVRTVEVYSWLAGPESSLLFSIIHDVTQRVETRQALQEYTRRLERAEVITKLGHWEFHLSDNAVFASEGAKQIYGLTGDTWTIPEVQEIPLPQYREMLDQAIIDLVQYQTPYDVTFSLFREQDGQTVTVRSIAEYDHEDQVIFGSLLDITEFEAAMASLERQKDSTIRAMVLFAVFMTAAAAVLVKLLLDRKRQAEKLEESEQEYRHLFASNPNPMWIYDPETRRVLEVNHAASRIYGYSREEFLAMDLRDHFGKDLPCEGMNQDNKDLQNSVMITHRTKEQREISAEISCHGLQWNSSPCLLVLAVDMTEILQAEAQQRMLEQQLHQAKKLEFTGRLAGGIAHDFNNMLSVIIGHAELSMQLAAADSPLLTSLQEIRQAAERTAELTRQLTAYASRQIISPVPCVLSTRVRDMAPFLEELAGSEVTVHYDLDEEIPPAAVDPDQFDQMLTNLIINAVDAIEGNGSVTIEVKHSLCVPPASQKSPENFVIVRVTDTGCGMDDHTRENLFEPFFTIKSTGKGTGLGMAMVYGAVRQNKGYIDTASEPGKGTAITLYFPALDEKVLAAETGKLSKDDHS